MIKVSVIVPVYNSQDYLKECLDCILGQTLKEIEVICIDDGSTDASLFILQEYKEKDKRVQVYSQRKANAGVARNLGLSKAKGEYLSFLDSDDLFSRKMLEKAYTAAKKNQNVDIVIFGADEYNINTKRSRFVEDSMRIENCPPNNPFKPIEMKDHLFNSFKNWAWNKIFRAEFVRKNKISFQDVGRTNDLLFTASCLVLADSILTIDEALATYRTGPYTHLQSTNHLDPEAPWNAYVKTYFRLEEILQGSFEDYRKSYLNCVLSGLRYNVTLIEKDAEAGNRIRYMIAEKAEEIFRFLDLSDESYYDADDIKWYKNLLNECARGYRINRLTWHKKRFCRFVEQLHKEGLRYLLYKVPDFLKK